MFSRLADNLATDLASGIGPREILGSNLVEYWDSTAGIGLVSSAADTWTGQKLGLVLTAPAAGQRPVYGADGSNFGGASVVQCAITNSKCMNIPVSGTNFFTTGQKPFILWVGRYRTLTAAQTTAFFVQDTASTQVTTTGVFTGGVNWFSQWFSVSARTDGAAVTTSPVTVRTDLRASDGKNELGIDSAALVVSGTGAAITVNINVAQIGNDRGARFSDTSHRGLILCAAVPTTAEIAALYRYVNAEWMA